MFRLVIRKCYLPVQISGILNKTEKVPNNTKITSVNQSENGLKTDNG